MKFYRFYQTTWFQSKRQHSLSTDVLHIDAEVLPLFYLPFQANAKYFFQNSYLFIIRGHFPLYNVVCFAKYKSVTQSFLLLQREW